MEFLCFVEEKYYSAHFIHREALEKEKKYVEQSHKMKQLYT